MNIIETEFKIGWKVIHDSNPNIIWIITAISDIHPKYLCRHVTNKGKIRDIWCHSFELTQFI